MYKLSRLLILLALSGVFYTLGLVAFALPWFGIGMGVAIGVRILRRGYAGLTTLGRARFANEKDLRRAGMLGGETGMLIGHAQRSIGAALAVRNVLSPRLAARESCHNFFGSLARRRNIPVRLSQAVHTAVFAPTGAGKGVSMVIPTLLTSPESMVVFDLKGENAAATAEHRKKYFGHDIALIDPYRVFTQKPDTLNPFDLIAKDDPLGLDWSNDLAEALVIRTGEEREPHWNDMAEKVLSAVGATVVRYGERDRGMRSLQTVADIISDPQSLNRAVELMRASSDWDGMLARRGNQMLYLMDKEKASTLTTVTRHLKFLDTPSIAECTKTSSFDATQLRKGKLTVYLILPPQHLRAQAGLVRMLIGTLLRVIVQGGLQ